MTVKKSQKNAAPPAPPAPLRAMVKLYDVVLTFDTNKPNEQIEEETNQLIEKINKLLSKHITDTLPQLFKDKTKKIKIAIVPIKPDEPDE